MSLEYVVVGRRPLPRGARPWTFELAGSDDGTEELHHPEEDMLDEGSLELCEIEQHGNEAYFSSLAALVGFEPRAVVCIRPAAWDMSRIAAEVVADGLDGVSFIDGLVDEHGLEHAARPNVAARSLEELEARIIAGYHNPRPFLDRWAEHAAASQTEREREDPAYREAIRYANDWSDVSDDD